MSQNEMDSMRLAARSGWCRSAWLSGLCALALLACSSSDDKHPSDAGAAGKGGASGHAGGAAGSSGAGGTLAAPVACGSNQCTAPANPLSAFLPGAAPTSLACCADAAKGTCGVMPMAADAGCEPPAVSDARCPGLDLGALAGVTSMFGLGMMTGCCVDDMCGLDGMIFGRGCVENSQAQTLISSVPAIGSIIMVPPSLKCDRPLDSDGGVEDAGL